jgi:hypothetical protein
VDIQILIGGIHSRDHPSHRLVRTNLHDGVDPDLGSKRRGRADGGNGRVKRIDLQRPLAICSLLVLVENDHGVSAGDTVS